MGDEDDAPAEAAPGHSQVASSHAHYDPYQQHSASAASHQPYQTQQPISHAVMPGQQVMSAHDMPGARIHEAPGFQQSTAPVALNLEDELPEPTAKPRRKVGLWLLAAAGVAAAGFTHVRSDLLSGSDNKQASQAKAPEATLAAQPYEPGPTAKGGAKKEAQPNAAEESKSALAKSDEPNGEAPIGSIGS